MTDPSADSKVYMDNGYSNGRWFETIIFDLDGTLVDTLPDLHSALNRVLSDRNVPLLTPDQVKKVIGPGKDDFLEILLPGASPKSKELFLNDFRTYYWEHCLDKTTLYPDMVSVLQTIRERTLVVASNKPVYFTEKILTGLNIRHLFKKIIGPDENMPTKPEPDMINKVIADTQSDPNRTIFIGDSEPDMKAGRDAGVAICGVRYGYGKVDRIEMYNPDFMIDSPADLLKLFKNHKHKLEK